MLNIKWNELFLKQDWGNALKQLISEARASSLENNTERRFVCQEELIKFNALLPPGMEDLKLIAESTIKNLHNDQLREGINAIDQYLEQLEGSVSSLEEITTAVNQKRSMLISRTIEILDQASTTIDVLVKLEKQLAEPNQDLILRINAVSRSIQELFVFAEDLKNARESTD